MNYLPIVLLIGLLALVLFYSKRARRRQADAEEQRRGRITVGTDVMTTSGLYGTVVAINDEQSVQLSIAPGIEVKWAFAALRDVSTLPDQYRKDRPEGRRGDTAA